MGSDSDSGSSLDPQKELEKRKKALEQAWQDTTYGAAQILEGQVERGVTGVLAAQTQAATLGQAPIKGPRAIAQDRADAAKAFQDQATVQERELAGATEKARLDKITNRLNEEIKLRRKQPGRSQTLLTSNMTPSAGNTNTLLTNAVNSMGGR